MDEQERAEIQANMLELKATLQWGERVETRGITARPDGTQGKFVGWLRTGRGAGNAYVEFDGEGRATRIHPSGLRRVGLSPATELADLKRQLAEAQAAAERYRVALEEIVSRGVENKPVIQSDYAKDKVSKGRETGIASAYYVHGKLLGRYEQAQIARKALE